MQSNQSRAGLARKHEGSLVARSGLEYCCAIHDDDDDDGIKELSDRQPSCTDAEHSENFKSETTET